MTEITSSMPLTSRHGPIQGNTVDYSQLTFTLADLDFTQTNIPRADARGRRERLVGFTAEDIDLTWAPVILRSSLEKENLSTGTSSQHQIDSVSSRTPLVGKFSS